MIQKKDYLITLSDIRKIMDLIVLMFTDNIDSQLSSEALSQLVKNNWRTIHIFYHGHMWSWIIFHAIIVRDLIEAGGGNRVPFGIFHKFLANGPFLKKVLRKFANVEPIYGFAHLKEILSSGPYTDVGIYPEGHNAFFSDGKTVQKFVSDRFVELAIETDFKICIHVFSGARFHYFPIMLNSVTKKVYQMLPLFEEKLLSTQEELKIPILRKIPLVRSKSEVFIVNLKKEELSNTPAIRKKQIHEEANRVRERMQQMLNEVHSELDVITANSPVAVAAEPTYPEQHGRRQGKVAHKTIRLETGPMDPSGVLD